MTGKGLYDILINDAGVAAELGTRIYPGKAPYNTVVGITYAVYNQIDSESIMSLTAHSGLAKAVYQIDVFDTNYGDAHEAMEAIRLALQDYTGTNATQQFVDCFAGPMDDSIGNLADGSEDKVYRVSRDFTLWWCEPAPA